MFDSSGFLAGVIGIVNSLLTLYMYVVIVRVLISWVNPDPYNAIVQFLRGITDPALDAMRRVLPSFLWSSGLDFTPLALILSIQVVILLLDSIRLPN